MKKLFLILLIAFAACKEDKNRSEDILSKEQMVSVLTDIHIAEAQVGMKNLPLDSSKKVFTSFENEILKKYKIDSAVFKRSYQYYLKENLKEMDVIYSAVVDSLSMREVRKKLY